MKLVWGDNDIMLGKIKLLITISIAILFFASSFSNATMVSNTIEEETRIRNMFKNIFGDTLVKSTLSNGRAEIVINVSKHVLPGSDLTLQEWEQILMKWIEKANEIWDGILEFRQVGTIDHVDNTSSNRTAGAINIYGNNNSGTPPGNPGSCYDRTHIVVGNGSANDTLAHEFGHWFNGIPDNTTTEHGNLTGTYPGYPGYSGYDTDGDGDCDENDTGNVMFPGVSRNDSNTDDEQRRRVRENASDWVNQTNAVAGGNGNDSVDNIGDCILEYIDITHTRVWIEYVNDEYTMHFTILLNMFIMELGFEIGIYFDSDGDLTTGEPGTGIDYYLGFNPYSGDLVFNRCDDGTWIPGESVPIDMLLEEVWVDGPYLPDSIGLTFSLPLSSLERHGSDGSDFFYYAKTSTVDFFDLWPDAGFCDIAYPLESNEPPSAPTIYGPNKGDPNTEYIFTIKSIDPDDDDVFYFVDWGDGSNTGWMGPFTSGMDVDFVHTWTSKDVFSIKAKARDTNNLESDWTIHRFSTPRTCAIFNFLQNHPNMFPILRLLLQRLEL